MTYNCFRDPTADNNLPDLYTQTSSWLHNWANLAIIEVPVLATLKYPHKPAPFSFYVLHEQKPVWSCCITCGEGCQSGGWEKQTIRLLGGAAERDVAMYSFLNFKRLCPCDDLWIILMRLGMAHGLVCFCPFCKWHVLLLSLFEIYALLF